MQKEEKLNIYFDKNYKSEQNIIDLVVCISLFYLSGEEGCYWFTLA